MDDGTLGGDVDTVLDDLKLISEEFRAIGLELNFSKSELFVSESVSDRNCVIGKFNDLAPNISIVDKSSLRLLGSPILDESFPAFVDEKIQNFNQTSDRLLKINSHMAFTIIKFCLFVPKFTYVLRCCQLWKHSELVEGLDNMVKNTLSSVLNIALDDRAWSQASLPVRLGGLGIRKISSVALPAFISSAYSTSPLVEKILTPSVSIRSGTIPKISHLDEAVNAWHVACPNTAPPKTLSSQRLWDGPLCEVTRNCLLQTCSTSSESARLLAVSKWESGLWLQAMPSRTIGTLMDPLAFRVAVCLRLGAPWGLNVSYMFEPFGVETLGPWGPGAFRVFKDLSGRLVEATCDQRAGSYLAQRISIAIQRGNAASILGTLPSGVDLDQLSYL